MNTIKAIETRYKGYRFRSKRALVIANYQRVIAKELDNIAKLINIVEIMSERQLGWGDGDAELVEALRTSIQEQKTMFQNLMAKDTQ